MRFQELICAVAAAGTGQRLGVFFMDRTVQIGTVKCFAVGRSFVSADTPCPRRCLQREDLVLIALTPMQRSDAVAVGAEPLKKRSFGRGCPPPDRFGRRRGCAGRHRAVLRRSSPRILDLRYGSARGRTYSRKLPAEGAPQVARDSVARLGRPRGSCDKRRWRAVCGAVASPQGAGS